MVIWISNTSVGKPLPDFYHTYYVFVVVVPESIISNIIIIYLHVCNASWMYVCMLCKFIYVFIMHLVCMYVCMLCKFIYMFIMHLVCIYVCYVNLFTCL